MEHDEIGTDENACSEQEKEPLLYCKIIEKHHKKCFGLTFIGQLSAVVISVILYLTGHDLLPLYFDGIPLDIRDEPYFPRELAWTYRDDFKNKLDWKIQNKIKPRFPRGMSVDGIEVILKSNGPNIFTKATLESIEDIEEAITGVKNFSQFCQLDTLNGNCKKPRSLLRYFDGTYSHVHPSFNDTTFSNIPGVIYEASTRNETKDSFAYFLGKEAQVTRTRARGVLTRLLIPLGYPLAGITDKKENEERIKDYIVTHIKPTLSVLKEETKPVEFIYFSRLLFWYEVTTQAKKDVRLTIGSMLFIFCFMVFHTRSLWISIFGIFSILTCFIATNLVYNVIIGFRYVGFFHILSIFIILGIGADDLFIFYDTWRATEFKSYSSLAHRLSACYRKATLSMFITSLTTTIAFFSTAFTSLLATKSFGVFSGMLVVILYLSVVLFFPNVIVMYHLHFEQMTWPCLRPCLNRNKAAKYSKNSRSSISSIQNEIKSLSETELNEVDGQTAARKPYKNKQHKKKNILVRFFRGPYYHFVTNKIAKWIIIVVFIAVITFFTYQTTRIVADNEDLKIWRKDRNFGKAKDLNLNGFAPNSIDKKVTIYILWGILERDMSSCHFSDVECFGRASTDPEFDASSPEAQLALKHFCDTLYNFTDSEMSTYKIKRNHLTNEPQIFCFTKDFSLFMEDDIRRGGGNLPTAWDYNNTIHFMAKRANVYNTSMFDSNFKDFLEIPVSYWMYDAYRMKYTPDFGKYSELIGRQKTSYSMALKANPNVYYGNKIRYIAARVDTTLPFASLGYEEGLPVADLWGNFLEKQKRNMPKGLKNGFQATERVWHWLRVQQLLAQNAVTGVIIGLACSFPILVIATKNVFIGFFSTICIGCVTVCVIGIIPLAGWKLGVMESLNMCLVVGLSVDYVVHLAEGYHSSKHHDRRSRVRDMLEDIGISVFSGACTTLGASCFMLFSEIRFFFKFGLFMFSTIGFSLLMSLGFFTTVMGIIGPQGNTGSLTFLCKLCNRKSSDEK